MKLNEKYKVSKEFEDIFSFTNEEEELRHDAQMLMLKFLEEIEKSYVYGPKLKKKDLAEALGKSTSFISQLYSGDKLINFPLLAKIQKAFNITFEIKAHFNSLDYKGMTNQIKLQSILNEPEGSWGYRKPDYSDSDECCDSFDLSKNITAA
ncbi:MAG: helix-turn-helix domain-containing protein [Cytophagaceae bacterium]